MPIPPSDPGYIPLRPLRVGELLGVGFGVARRHLALLGPLAVLISALSAAVDLTLMSASGTLETFASGEWITSLRDGLVSGQTGSLPTALYASVTASALVSIAGCLWLSGVAAACIGADAVGRGPTPGMISDRLRGHLWVTALVALVVGAATLLGSMLLIVPGVLAFTVWAAAAPASTMEGASPGLALSRSARLTRGHRWRILGVTVIVVAAGALIDALIASLVLSAMGITDAVMLLIVGDVVTALTSAFTLSWVAAVIALLYVDLRIRVENLGPALRAQASRLG